MRDSYWQTLQDELLDQLHKSGALLSLAEMTELKNLKKDVNADLFTLPGAYFSPDQKQAILKLAAKRWSDLLLQDRTKPLNYFWLDQLWRSLVLDFHNQQHWGQVPDSQPVKEPKQKIGTPLGFIWTTFQSLVLAKTAVLYFGGEYSKEPSPYSLFWLIVAIAASAGSLIFFAWHKSRKDNLTELSNRKD